MIKPPAATQIQKSIEERGDNPCNTEDPGFGSYASWVKLSTAGQALVPRARELASDGAFDVVVHFHGHDPARKQWVRVAHHQVFAGITLGVGSGVYQSAYQAPAAFSALLGEIERAVAERTGRSNAHVGRIALSAWSAGYGAVEAILRVPAALARVDAVVLLDGLHADYQGDGLDATELAPFVRFAKLAAAGRRLMVVSHSSIIPPGYASTTETSNYLIDAVGGRPRRAEARKSDPFGLELISRFDRKGFHVLGYAGNGRLDHCAQVGLFGDILKVHLLPRWKRAP